jgi:hypothetical protein
LENKIMKKTFVAFTLALVTVFGATFAQAGILISDNRCTETQNTGILISDFTSVSGAVDTIGGIIVGDYTGCRTGILISD